MKIAFHGATGDVTGSAYHVKTRHASVLVDCGLFQGGKEERARNYRPARLEGGHLDAVVVTHGHLDHVGRLPLLTRKGYRGPIYATQATIDVGRRRARAPRRVHRRGEPLRAAGEPPDAGRAGCVPALPRP